MTGALSLAETAFDRVIDILRQRNGEMKKDE
jgi:hypothetical protein